jgi:hypothetical protein
LGIGGRWNRGERQHRGALEGGVRYLQVADGPTRWALVQQLPSDVMGVARVLCFSVVQVPVINGLTDHSHSCQLMGVIAAAVA